MIPMWDSKLRCEVMTPVVTIDGFRSRASRTAEYEGQTEPQWCGQDGVWRDVWLENSYPVAARIGVWRKNFRSPAYGVARWSTYCATDKDNNPKRNWQKMPDLMLAKCAEALALRKAFPAEFGGVYAQEEMEQSTITVTPEPAREERPQLQSRQAQPARQSRQAQPAQEPVPYFGEDDIPFGEPPVEMRQTKPRSMPTTRGDSSGTSTKSESSLPPPHALGRPYAVIDQLIGQVSSPATREILTTLRGRKLMVGDEHHIASGVREANQGSPKNLNDLLRVRSETVTA